MTLAVPLVRRLSMLGCVALGAAALALSACGEGGTATPASTAAKKTTVGQGTKAAPAGRPCPGRVDGFLESLNALRRRLAVGLSYEQYVGKMDALRASYDEIPVDRLSIGCLASAGTPGERALNEYIDAANSWGGCLADAACTTASIEPVLQRQWRLASRLLSEAG